MRRDQTGADTASWIRWTLFAAGVTWAAAMMLACTSSSATPADGGAGDVAQFDDSGATGEDGGVDATVMEMDAASPDATLADGSTAEAGDAAAEGAVSDAAEGGDGEAGTAMPTLWLGGNVRVQGITSDNYVIYEDVATDAFYARPLAGGASLLLYTTPASIGGSFVTVKGRIVFIYGWGNYYVGSLMAWSSPMTQPVTLTSTGGLGFLYETSWPSSDSQHIVYLVGKSGTNGSVSDIYGANADGTGATVLASSVNTYYAATTCFPRVAFQGDRAVISYCSAADAGTTPVIQSYAMSSGWTPSVVVTNWIDQARMYIEDQDPASFAFGIEPDGGQIVAASSTSGNGSLQVFPVDGGSGTVIDPTWQADPGLSFAGTRSSDPWSVCYNTDAGVLKQSPVANPAPRVLLDGGVNYFDAFSRDGKWMLVSNAMNPAAFFADISLVSTVYPGQSQLLATSAQYGGLPIAMANARYEAFTTDQAYAIVFTNLIQNNEGSWLNYVRVAAVDGSSATQLVSNGYAVGETPLQGSKIMMADNFQEADASAGAVTVDLHVVDPSVGGPGTVIASRLPGSYAIANDRSTVLYDVTEPGAPGIYVYVVP
jgi:hypothetical protein